MLNRTKLGIAARRRERRRVACFGGLYRRGGERWLFGLDRSVQAFRFQPVRPGEDLQFSLLCPVPGFCGIGLAVGEPRAATAAGVIVEMRKEWARWERVFQGEIRMDPADGADWHWIEFDPLADSHGKVFRVRLSCDPGHRPFSVSTLKVPRGQWSQLGRYCKPEVLEQRFEKGAWDAPAAWHPGFRPQASRELRILTYRWHVPHQYELYKLPHRFFLVHGLPGDETKQCDSWSYTARPKPPNATFIPWDEVRLDDYDLLLSHFDENVLDPQNTRGAISPDWGATFRFFMSLPGLPRVALCHGTPQFRGMFDESYGGPLFEELDEPKRKLLELLGDTLVVCNSHQAREQWGFPDSRVIWHGFDPEEFPLGSRRGGIVGPGPALRARPHYRGLRLHEEVVGGLPERSRPVELAVPEPGGFPRPHGNAYARAKFRAYIDALGEFSAYLNPTLNSPMPRGRGEAMMCGLSIVTARNHDVERFIDNERNGFYAADANQLREYMRFLAHDRDAAREIGRLGRQRAIEVFHIRRYLREWNELLAGLVG